MAEFQEVCKQWRRMCEHGSEGIACADCKMYSSVDVSVCRGIPDEDEAKIIEGFVMQWAAEHPEPVYPTWWKYMCMIGVIPNTLGDKTLGEVTVERLMHINIPADIAQKLGLQPVPVVHGDYGTTNEADARKKLGIKPKEGT